MTLVCPMFNWLANGKEMARQPIDPLDMIDEQLLQSDDETPSPCIHKVCVDGSAVNNNASRNNGDGGDQLIIPMT